MGGSHAMRHARHRPVPPVRERLEAGGQFPRHHHGDGYLTLVVSGDYEEAGDCGRISARSGDVLVHFPFDGHADAIGRGGATVLNLALPDWWPDNVAYGRVEDLDDFVRLAERGEPALAALVRRRLIAAAKMASDWPDLLAADLRADPALLLADWADAHGLDPATVSRGFRRAFGVSAAQFRLQRRAKAAWAKLGQTHSPLAQVACETGFADQAHMHRAVAALTGRTPGQWRRQVNSVQEGAAFVG